MRLCQTISISLVCSCSAFPRLLDVLAGRKDPNGLSGTLLLDGRPTPENFKCMVGYVVQVKSVFYNCIEIY